MCLPKQKLCFYCHKGFKIKCNWQESHHDTRCNKMLRVNDTVQIGFLVVIMSRQYYFQTI